MNIIIIDDDSVFRETLQRSLVRLDCHVEIFAKPSDALSTIKTTESLIVLLDLKLESDSGLRWIESIREANRESQIILLTGYASISTAVEAIKLGANDYLPKPITYGRCPTFRVYLKEGRLGLHLTSRIISGCRPSVTAPGFLKPSIWRLTIRN